MPKYQGLYLFYLRHLHSCIFFMCVSRRKKIFYSIVNKKLEKLEPDLPGSWPSGGFLPTHSLCSEVLQYACVYWLDLTDRSWKADIVLLLEQVCWLVTLWTNDSSVKYNHHISPVFMKLICMSYLEVFLTVRKRNWYFNINNL